MINTKKVKILSVFMSLILMSAIVLFSACGSSNKEYMMQFDEKGETGDGYVYAQVLVLNMSEKKDLEFVCEDFTTFVNGEELKGKNFITSTEIETITISIGGETTTTRKVTSGFSDKITIKVDCGDNLQIVFETTKDTIGQIYYKGNEISNELKYLK